MVAASVRRSSAQAISNATDTTVNWTDEDYDTDAFWDAGTPGRITIPEDGTYHFDISIEWEANNTGQRQAWIELNGGATVYGKDTVISNSSALESFNWISLDLDLVAGDYLQVRVRQNSTASLNVRGTRSSHVNVHKVGGAKGDTGATGATGATDPSGAWPIGSVFLSVDSTNPATLLGIGTWTQIAQGQFLVGQKAADADFGTVEGTGGAKTHTHDYTQVVQHTHTITITDPKHQHGMAEGQTDGAGTFMDRSNAASATTAVTDLASTGITASSADPAGSVATGTTASGSSLPPFFVVYAWKRTA